MAAEYILTATSWRDAQGVRHHRGDVVSPPAAEVDRLLRARAITTPEAAAAAETAAIEAAEAAQPDGSTDVEAQVAADAAAADSTTLEGVVPPVIVPGGIEKPAKAAPVKKWEDYVVALHEASGGKEGVGLTRAEAEAWSKPDLIAKFG